MVKAQGVLHDVKSQGSLLFVELNCENLFDCEHDSLKNDYEFCEGGSYHWTKGRFWKKLNNIGREIISCGGEGDGWQKPDLVALVEVENDSVMTWLTERSMLRNAHYRYVMTDSPDQRGIDVALLYDEMTFKPIEQRSIRITPPEGARPTRDILYVKGIWDDDTLYVYVVHAPSRSGGEKETEPYRRIVSDRLCQSIDSVMNGSRDAKIIVAGDFNDYHTNRSVKQIEQHGMRNVSAGARGQNGAEGTYRYRGEWGSLDQILVSEGLLRQFGNISCMINDAPFLVTEETKYGGVKPRRVYTGPRYDSDGFSDHLPLVMVMSNEQ